MTIRFTLVDTPERGQDGYEEATAFTERLCPEGSEVVVDEDDGQRVRLIWQDDRKSVLWPDGDK